jgi:hypothetical protein
MNRKATIAVSIAVGALVLGAAADSAQAQYYYPGHVVAAPPVYYAPPVYVAPPPVYYYPQPVYAPVYRPVYPRPVYGRPVYGGRGFSFGFDYRR